MSVENAKKVVKFLAKTTSGVQGIIKGGLDSSDIGPGVVIAQDLITVFPCFVPAYEELKSMDTAGAAELVAAIATELVLEDKKVEAIIEASIEMLPGIIKLVQAIRAPAEAALPA